MVSSISGNQIAVTGLPSFLGPFLTPPLVQTFVGVTAFDGVADVNSLAAPDVVSFRALYLHASPTFLAAKVRKH